MKKIYFLLLLGIVGIISSCGPSKSRMTVANKQIPPEFSSYEGTLLIISQYKTWDKYARNAFKNNYKGKFKIIKNKELENYSDIEEYRYIISPKFSSSLNTAPSSSIGSSHVSSETLTILDRKANKQYKTENTAMYGKLLKRYSAALEMERIK